MPPNQPDQQALAQAYHQARALHREGRLDEASELYLQINRAAPGQPQVLHGLGVIAHQKGDLGEAVLLIQQAVGLNSEVATFHNNLGNALKGQGRDKQAEASYQEALRLKPDYSLAQLNLARMTLEKGDPVEAESLCRGALQASSHLGSAHCLLAEILGSQKRFEEAVSVYKEAIRRDPNLAEAYTGLGHIFRQMQDSHQAISAFKQVIRLEPNSASGYQNLGSLYLLLNHLEESEKFNRKALELSPGDFAIRYNLGTSLSKLGRLGEAREHLEAVVEAQPEAINAVYELNQLRSNMCDWASYDDDVAQLASVSRRFLEEDSELRLPLLFLQRYDLPSDLWTALLKQQGKVIEKAVALLKRPDLTVSPTDRPDRLRIGYVSPDFRAHAVGLLVHSMFALHDRSEFEIYGYTLTNPDQFGADKYFQAVRDGCDELVDLSALSTLAAAERIAADQIHILIDLAGHTTFARPEMTALRPAPIQAHYLGFLDTMGADFLPYIIADETVIPESLEARYTEHLIAIPDTFAVAAPFEIDSKPVTRSEFGLPEGEVVFCCFNHVYKIEPVVFEAWMAILKAVPGSVLWLYDAGVQEAVVNLKREAETRGISPDRLIFAQHAPIEQHLARCALADLFLDTFVYNAGTTGVLALWAGLPVLTKPGERYLNRMGASLAKAVGLPELVCEDTDAYVEKAVHLANHPEELSQLHDQLWQTRADQPLYQTDRFVKHLELAYKEMWAQYVEGSRSDIRLQSNS